MLTIPWTTSTTIPAGSTLHQVSRLELTRVRDVPGFLVAALRLRRVVMGAPGAVGMSLRAAPSRRTFWTLSAWRDKEALDAFTRSDYHPEASWSSTEGGWPDPTSIPGLLAAPPRRDRSGTTRSAATTLQRRSHDGRTPTAADGSRPGQATSSEQGLSVPFDRWLPLKAAMSLRMRRQSGALPAYHQPSITSYQAIPPVRRQSVRGHP